MRKLKSPYVSIAGWGIFLAGALSLASCSTEELIDKEQTDIPIKFGEVKTRAEVSSSADVLDFSVFAEMTYLNDDGTEAKDENNNKLYISLLDNEKVYRNSSSEEFTYTNTRYWVKERTFRFFGVYPYTESGIDRVDDLKNEGSTFEYTGYTVDFTTPATADTDLMVAHKQETTEIAGTYPSYVEMGFQHLLSKISFNIKQDASKNPYDEFTITKMTIMGVKKSGTYRTSNHAGYTDNWNLNNDAIIINKIFEGDGVTINSTGVDVLGANKKGFLLLPQNTENIQVAIEYKYKQKGQTTGIAKEATGKLSGANWEAGKHYNYSLTLSVDNLIYFSTPTVETWGTAQSIGTIIFGTGN